MVKKVVISFTGGLAAKMTNCHGLNDGVPSTISRPNRTWFRDLFKDDFLVYVGLSSLTQIPCSKPDTFIFVQNGRCNFLGKNMSLCLFKVIFSLFTAKLPLNHHRGNMCVFFLGTERANLSDVCGCFGT